MPLRATHAPRTAAPRRAGAGREPAPPLPVVLRGPVPVSWCVARVAARDRRAPWRCALARRARGHASGSRLFAPAQQLTGHQLRVLLMREVPDAVDEPPLVRRGHVSPRALSGPGQDARIQGTVELKSRSRDR